MPEPIASGVDRLDVSGMLRIIAERGAERDDPHQGVLGDRGVVPDFVQVCATRTYVVSSPVTAPKGDFCRPLRLLQRG